VPQSQLVQQLVVIKLMPLQRVKGWFQMDAAREIHELMASFLAGFYQVGGPSGSGAPVLDP